MLLKLSGEQIAGGLLDVVASLTDRATLRHADVAYDSTTGVVRLPITRYPLIKKRRVLPNIHDFGNPIPALVTVRNVVSCAIENNAPQDPGEEVQLLFGLQIRDKQVFVCSAEEDKGQTCYSVTAEVSDLDIEIADLTEVKRGHDG